MAHQFKTPMVGDPIYAKEYIDKVLSNVEVLDRYHRGLMLCSNELVIGHPFYNTPEGREVWYANKFKCINSQNDTTAFGKSSLYEDEDGTIMIKTSIELPKKFLKFIKAMEKMNSYAIASLK